MSSLRSCGGLNSQNVEKNHFCVFFIKTTPYKNIFKILFQRNSSRHRLICCVQISCNLADGKSVTSWIAYLPQPQTVYWECSTFHPNRFTFGGVIPERVNTIKTGRKVFQIFGCSPAFSRIIIRIVRADFSFLHGYNTFPKLVPLYSYCERIILSGLCM